MTNIPAACQLTRPSDSRSRSSSANRHFRGHGHRSPGRAVERLGAWSLRADGCIMVNSSGLLSWHSGIEIARNLSILAIRSHIRQRRCYSILMSISEESPLHERVNDVDIALDIYSCKDIVPVGLIRCNIL